MGRLKVPSVADNTFAVHIYMAVTYPPAIVAVIAIYENQFLCLAPYLPIT